ncbi:hypothetical protein LSUE1_G001926 [Lachnellula suecica]|uniref:Cupin type-2 domain-containing protein n=1 Tax=Lachnellula suecica TaxID=602035 RepID=A0A8T9CJK7_9HELO|nr:hypothetical protein LSUE1_G001926 [Lachnellula suecica]
MATIIPPTVDEQYSEPGVFTKFPGEGLPDIKRYITTHDKNGEGVFLPHDNGAHHSLMANGRGVQNIIYSTTGDQVDLEDDADMIRARDMQPGIHEPHGTVFRMIDFAPGVTSPLHRAMSIDYGTVIEGEFEIGLDSGETRIMRRGDVLVQRATVHQWTNLSPDKPARMLFVLLDVKPLKPINGKEISQDLGPLKHDFGADH